MNMFCFSKSLRRSTRGFLISTVKWAFLAIGVSAMIVMGGCGGKGGKNANLFAGQGSPIYPGSGPLPKGGGRRHVGNPYTINGQRFYPKDVASYNKVGVASWYGSRFHRRKTSNGEWFDMNDLTAAHTTLPLPSYVKVTNLDNGKEAVVRVNDRGPFANDRIIDLSKRAAGILGLRGKGTQKVRIVLLDKAPLNHDGYHLNAMNRKHLSRSDYAAVASAMNYRSAPSTRYADAGRTTGGVVKKPVSNKAGYFVQAASFINSDNAYRARRRLSSLGPVSVNRVAVGHSTYYSVRVGPLANARSAYDVTELIRQQGMADARIITH